ncbi:MAG: hypothetical protein ABI867_45640 [Kofleriaceae bacterium]
MRALIAWAVMEEGKLRGGRPTAALAHDEVEKLAVRSMRPTDPSALLNSRPTIKLGREQLLGLLGETAAEDGVIDLHALEPAGEVVAALGTNKHVVMKQLASAAPTEVEATPILAPVIDAPAAPRRTLRPLIFGAVIAAAGLVAMVVAMA